jgi:hypothetical protein
MGYEVAGGDCRPGIQESMTARIRALTAAFCLIVSVLAGLAPRPGQSRAGFLLTFQRVAAPVMRLVAARTKAAADGAVGGGPEEGAYVPAEPMASAAGALDGVPGGDPCGTGGSAPTSASRALAAHPGPSAEANPASQVAAAVAAKPAPARLPRHRAKTGEESRVEAFIEKVYRQYFRECRIGDRSLGLRIPFGLNDERRGRRGYSQSFLLGAKGTPQQLWPYIDSVLGSSAFGRYVEALSNPGEKLIIFDLERRSYSVSRDSELIESLKAGRYPGTPTRIFVYRSGSDLTEADAYNYLYAVASVGVDCSGLAHHVQQSLALAWGMDLDRMLAGQWRTSPTLVGRRVGLWFYDPASGYTVSVGDRIEDLRPADMILFRGSDGQLKHSAVIQSVDFENGLIRYIQSTDWAPEAERGIHESLIRFDPAQPRVSLGHHSVRWLQQVRPSFEGELEPRDWQNDGDRYLWYPAGGGSVVVRLRYLADAFLRREPLFYTNLYSSPD